MIVEERRYTFHPGTLAVFLDIYASEGLAVQRGHLPHLLGYYVSEVGPLNQITAHWGYPSFDAREKWRAALAADPRWVEFLSKVRPLMSHQECRILKPAPFYKQALSEAIKSCNFEGVKNETS